MISEINTIEDNDAWWIDSEATKHMYAKTKTCLRPMCHMNVLFMGNASTAIIKGKGTIELEFTFGKVLTLSDVYHVAEVRKNLVSGSLLNKFRFKLVFE